MSEKEATARIKINRLLEAAGWRIVLVTWDDVTMRPAETIDRLLLALRDAAA